MAATAGRTIAGSWRKILHGRLRTRPGVISLDEEHNMARRMFASLGARPILKSTPPVSRDCTPKPLLVPLPGRWSPKSFHHFTRSQSKSLSPPGYTAPTVPSTNPPEKTIEDMLAVRDESSDDGGANSSDDELRPPRHSGLGLTNLDEKAPFAFSIGPDGFNVDKITLSRKTLHTSHVQFDRKSFSSMSPSPALVSFHPSGSSAPSDAGLDSTSETERILRPVDFEPARAHYAKPAKRAERRNASRSATPGNTASPMSTHSPIPTSPAAFTIDRPLRELSETIDFDGDHVGQLIREREEYQTYRHDYVRASGRMMSEEIEIAIKKWVEEKKRSGLIPHVFSKDYLASLGIHGDPNQMDLGPWIETMRDRMSPIEALLRLGIRPTEFPPHCMVHSLLHLDQLLNRYHESEIYAAVGENIDEAQLDQELSMLFRNGEERLEDVLLSEAEQSIREQLIKAAGVWDDATESRGTKFPRKTGDELQQIANAFEADEDDADDGDGIHEAMLSSWWASEEGRSRLNGLLGDAEEPEREVLRRRASDEESGEQIRSRPKTKRKTGEGGGQSDAAVQVRSKKVARKTVRKGDGRNAVTATV